MGIVMKEENAAEKIFEFVGIHSIFETTAYNISKELKMPLSTAQRGIKILAKSGTVSVVKEEKEREYGHNGTKLKYRGLKRKYYDFTFLGALTWLFRSTDQITIEKFAENIDLYASILGRGIRGIKTTSQPETKFFQSILDSAKSLDVKEGMPFYRIALILLFVDESFPAIEDLDMFQNNEDSLLNLYADIFLDSAIVSAQLRKEGKDIKHTRSLLAGWRPDEEKKTLIKASFFPVFFESGFIEHKKQYYTSMLTQIEEAEKTFKKWKEEKEESKS